MILTSKPCPGCHTTVDLEVMPQDFEAWRYGGMLIQQAFPYLTKDQRERLISGYCGPCWDKFFKEPEE